MKKLSLLFLFIFPFICCGSVPTEEAATTYSIGGTVSGLSGTLVLQNNAGDDLTLTADGAFTFSTELADAADYAITVSTQPTDETCSISNSTGTVAAADVTDISIVCSSATYTVGGTLTGLSGTVVLQNNAGNDLTLTADGAFTFSTAVADGAGYLVSVKTSPVGQACTASDNFGTISGADIIDVVVTCSSNTYTVSGTLSGLSGTVVLQNNSVDNLPLTENGVFTFATAVADNAGYLVTVKTSPSGQTCTLSNNTGTISGANVTTVGITCSANPTYTVGGTIANLGGSETVVLQNNLGDNLSRTSNGSFTFSTALESGSAYSVTVSTQPSRQICTVTNGPGTMSNANVTSIAVTCTTTNPVFFLINAAHNGNFGGVSAADTLCMSDSNKPATGTYKALLVDGTVRRACSSADCTSASQNIDWVLAPNTTYYRSDRTTDIMTTNGAGVFPFGTLTHSFLTDSTSYWTGLSTDWTTHALTCSAWTSSAGGGDAGTGTTARGDRTSNGAIKEGTTGCSNALFFFLICVEQ